MNPSTEVECDYQLGQNGWASLRLTANGQSVDIDGFGDCEDSLGELIRAALHMNAGGYEAKVLFDGEPFEWRLVIRSDWKTATDGSLISVRVLTFPDIYGGLPDASGNVIFDTICRRSAFEVSIARAANHIFGSLGLEGYAERWRMPFPKRALDLLNAALEVT